MTEQSTATVIDADPVDRPPVGPHDDGAALAPVSVDSRRVVVPIGQPIGDLDEAYRLAKALAASPLLPDGLAGKPANVLVTILYGRELGLSAMTAIQGIYVAKGRPNLTGALWNAKVREAGHRVSSVEGSDDRGLPTCETTLTRGDTGESITVRWTIADAEAARLCTVVDGKVKARSQKGEPLPWESYTRDMLFWRTLVRCCRRLAPEVAFGFGLHDPSPMVNEQGVEIVEAERVSPPIASQPLTPVDAESVAADVRATVAEFTQPADAPLGEDAAPAADPPTDESDPHVPSATEADTAEPRVGDPECVLVHNNDGTVLHDGPCVTEWNPADDTQGDGTLPLDEPEAPPSTRPRR